MMNTTPSPIPVAATRPPLTVVLRTLKSRVELTREPVTEADLSELFSEAWLNTTLRKGHPHVPFDEAHLQLVPSFKEGSTNKCERFEVTSQLPDGSSHPSLFSLRSLEPVATRAADRLLESRALKPSQQYTYEVIVDDAAATTAPPGRDHLVSKVQTQPLAFLTVPLRPLLDQAKAVNIVDDDDFPVFYTEAALRQAERHARRGAAKTPPEESGAVMIGPLCSCPVTGNLFSVVHEAMEVKDAEQGEFSLQYTSKSWTRIRTLMKARQAARPQQCQRILGQCHGHNFIPNQGKTCEACPSRPVCDLTNLFVSQDDRNWTRAVFFRQPWQLCHIFGLTARGDKVQGLYGLRDGRLQERGFFVLPEFDVEHWSRASGAAAPPLSTTTT